MLRKLLLFALLVVVVIYLAYRYFSQSSSVNLINPAGITYVVSPSGDDSNPGTEARPFRTLERARDAVRTHVASGLNHNVLVYLRHGMYELTSPLSFTPADSGTSQYSITYRNYPGENAVITGGKLLPRSWTRVSGQLWKLSLPHAGPFHSLYRNDSRLTLARFPNTGYARIAAVNTAMTEVGFDQNIPDPSAWNASTGAELVTLYNWETSRNQIIGKAAGATPNLAAGNTIGNPVVGGGGLKAQVGRAVYLQGAKGLLDVAGEWYYDSTEKALYYYSQPNEDPNQATFYQGNLVRLLNVQGTSSQLITNLHFQNLQFVYTDYYLPPHGYNGIQHNYRLSAVNSTASQPNEAAFAISYASNVSVKSSWFKNLGSSGIAVGANTDNIFVQRNSFSRVGGNCVHLGYSENKSVGQDWSIPADVPEKISVTHNDISTCGQIFEGGTGIVAHYIRDSYITNNRVFDLPYTGITLFSNWVTTATSQKSNAVVANHVHDVMKLLSDGAGIYTNGNNTNSVIGKNLIHDVRSSGVVGNPNWYNNGIFLDNGTVSLNVVENIVYNSPQALRWNDTGPSQNNVTNNYFDQVPGSSGYPTALAAAAGPGKPNQPFGLLATCSNNSEPASLVWDLDPTTTQIVFRLDDTSNAWTNSCSNVNPGDVCKSLSPTMSYTFPSSSGHSYNWWMQACSSGGCSDTVSLQFTCAGTGSPSPSPQTKSGDFNGDGFVNLYDYSTLISGFGTKYTIYDYNTFLTNFGK